ncbi:hypothetical protein KNP414_04544 [Paenibacillus mucilaginosus KNP414]|uniref:Uncharacterized protein n=1 Tax=Paenibacillus mucilaginosus (strain KNP414) TaxID=1036673 RepID=F8FBM3_PAEMK|nr:hypothetical protein KNP414_04544 [Paenibacillus mucilaginosus KNP414]
MTQLNPSHGFFFWYIVRISRNGLAYFFPIAQSGEDGWICRYIALQSKLLAAESLRSDHADKPPFLW